MSGYIPFSPFVKPVAWAADALAGVLSAFGFNKPTL